ncbi:MAG: tRNA (adenosine(37)-N6)-threonylcarbamoyltransferase complex transferase subunit TsaD [Clostridia bacterium]|nr:tRNA (adenosine(37)-N6)-threonylcarbamoyltransferase complex transferase subunit TsaD [Clostridia bacterium]
MIRILGFESSCDETAVAVVEQGEDGKLRILSSIVASQVDTHRLYGGVVPEIASRAHTEAISALTYEALEAAQLSPKDITAVAVTSHPGLIGALLVAVNFAKSFALAHKLPLYSIDHMRAHIASAFLTEDAPAFPFLAITVSGGHTSLYAVQSPTESRLIGATRDDAIGEAFDKVGRLLGLSYPAGAAFDALAKEGLITATGKTDAAEALAAFPKCDLYRDPLYRLPSPALQGESLDFSFSGLKTAAVNLLHHLSQKGEEPDKAAFAARYTYEAVSAIAKKAAAALDTYALPAVVLCGGVAANSHLRAALSALCKRKKARLYVPPLSLCGDNAAMVAAEGCFAYAYAAPVGSELNASAAD